MTGRVNRYYQQPADPAFVKHMIHENGFCEEDQKIILDLRSCSGDTALHASRMGIPEKLYNQRVCAISVRMMAELFRLAEIGYRAEKSTH